MISVLLNMVCLKYFVSSKQLICHLPIAKIDSIFLNVIVSLIGVMNFLLRQAINYILA